jgi:hypothetical protein
MHAHTHSTHARTRAGAAQVDNTFEIHTHDKFGNALVAGGHVFDALLWGPERTVASVLDRQVPPARPVRRRARMRARPLDATLAFVAVATVAPWWSAFDRVRARSIAIARVRSRSIAFERNALRRPADCGCVGRGTQDGTYLVTYRLTTAGEYQLRVMYAPRHHRAAPPPRRADACVRAHTHARKHTHARMHARARSGTTRSTSPARRSSATSTLCRTRCACRPRPRPAIPADREARSRRGHAPRKTLRHRHHAMQRDATQRDVMQRDAMRCNAMGCNVMRCNAMRCNATRCNTMRCNATRGEATRQVLGPVQRRARADADRPARARKGRRRRAPFAQRPTRAAAATAA